MVGATEVTREIRSELQQAGWKTKDKRMLEKTDVVYDLRVENGKPTLRLVRIASRRRLSHDDAAGIADIPDIFVPLSAPGMAVAVYQASCPAMRAMGAMTDAGFAAIEDIDRLDMLRAAATAEAAAKNFEKIMAEFGERVAKSMAQSGTFKGPTPPVIAAAYAARAEYERRGRLAAAKLEAAERAAQEESQT